jgi:ABC-2 type transport system ATP-binding protein
MVELLNVKKSYGNYAVIDIPQIHLNHNIYWLKGMNGSGKTTLMKLIAGLLPFQGDVLINGNISIRKNRVAYLRLVNYAEAEPLFPPFLTGYDLIELFVKTKNALQPQAEELISSFGVSSYINNPLGTYSSGMLKKLSLILAFIGNAKLILLDEPLVTIDDKTVPIVTKLISDYYNIRGITFLLTSHQIFDASAFPDAQQLLMQEKGVQFV